MWIGYGFEQEMMSRMRERERRFSERDLIRRAFENTQRQSRQALIRVWVGSALTKMRVQIQRGARPAGAQPEPSGI